MPQGEACAEYHDEDGEGNDEIIFCLLGFGQLTFKKLKMKDAW